MGKDEGEQNKNKKQDKKMKASTFFFRLLIPDPRRVAEREGRESWMEGAGKKKSG